MMLSLKNPAKMSVLRVEGTKKHYKTNQNSFFEQKVVFLVKIHVRNYKKRKKVKKAVRFI